MSRSRVRAQVAEGLMLPVSLEEIEHIIASVLLAEDEDETEISIALISDEEIATMNASYLNHEGATDVISFALEGPGGRTVGDVYIGAEQARRQADEYGVPAGEEILRLAVHGTLHVLGYDHPAGPGRDGSPMYQRQEQLLALFLRDIGQTDR